MLKERRGLDAGQCSSHVSKSIRNRLSTQEESLLIANEPGHRSTELALSKNDERISARDHCAEIGAGTLQLRRIKLVGRCFHSGE